MGKSICLEHRSQVQILPEAAHFSLKMSTLGELCCMVMLCLSERLCMDTSSTEILCDMTSLTLRLFHYLIYQNTDD